MSGWADLQALLGKRSNFVLIGQAGSGKSEIALNLARILGEHGGKPVDFFDLDMTKPLFRARDVAAQLEPLGVRVHYEQQFEDAPTQVGGVRASMKCESCYTVLDVGGDEAGARLIGGYAQLMNQDTTAVFYVINPYRPWTEDIDQIDRTLSQILSVCHIDLQFLHLISNPNLGCETTEQDVLQGHARLQELLRPYAELCMLCVRRELYAAVCAKTEALVLPMDLFLTYEWHDEPDHPAQE